MVFKFLDENGDPDPMRDLEPCGGGCLHSGGGHAGEDAVYAGKEENWTWYMLEEGGELNRVEASGDVEVNTDTRDNRDYFCLQSQSENPDAWVHIEAVGSRGERYEAKLPVKRDTDYDVQTVHDTEFGGRR